MKQHREKNITSQAFARLGNEKLLHEYCDILHKLMGLVVDFISADDETLRLSGGSNFNTYCAAIRENPKGFSACHQCDVIHAFRGAKNQEAICYRCHAGCRDNIPGHIRQIHGWKPCPGTPPAPYTRHDCIGPS